MKFFEAVPGDLFSPLASPNRGLYADALDVLYAAYRENLKIPGGHPLLHAAGQAGAAAVRRHL